MKTRSEIYLDALTQIEALHGLTDREADWMSRLREQQRCSGSLEGDLRPMIVMFQFAEDRLKRPRIRFLADGPNGQQKVRMERTPTEGKSHYNLYFYGDASISEWSNTYRRYAGSVYPDGRFFFKPWVFESGYAEGLLETLNEFSRDPIQAAKAWAQRMATCMFCGLSLDDPRSVHVGYGETCAGHYNLPWGEMNLKEFLLRDTGANQKENP